MTEAEIPLALVTGAGHRIGRAIAFALAEQGYAIGLHYHHSQAQAEETASWLVQSTGSPAYLLPADLSQPAQIEDLFARAAGLPHPLRVLVNSAAVMPSGDLRSMAVEEWDTVLDLNLRAPWLCARSAARQMGPGGGSIINIGDSGAQKVWTSYPAYVISKAGLETLTRLLARALAPAVRVNAVAPGLVLPADSVSADSSSADTWKRLVDRLPLREAGQPEDVARAVCFFVKNPYITGQILAVDGGYQLI
jgi:pteridine reductase